MLRAANHTGPLIQSYQVFGSAYQSGKKYLGSCEAIQTNATQRVQRGTNLPSGKRYRKRPKDAVPRKWTKETGISQAGCRAASASMVNTKVAVPNVSSARETNRAMRSSDLRKKMRAATTPHTAAKTTSIATVYAAKKPSERPRSSSARRPAGGSCPVGHAAVGHGPFSNANPAGRRGINTPTASTATATHAVRARVR